MSLSFATEEYSNCNTCVSWYGTKFNDCKEFNTFLEETVKSRLNDSEGNDRFNNCLRGLDLTGMGRDCLEEVLTAEIIESRDWAIGEALAESFLMESYKVIFPWNMDRDKRNPLASLPGADLVGFIEEKDGFRFLFGEVKTSTEKKSPPQVMLGRSGMKHQLDNLSDNMGIIHQLLKWLSHRLQNEKFMEAYKSSCVNYFNSGCKDVFLLGILIRDTTPNEIDLSGRGKKLRENLSSPTKCHLIALYLPWSIENLSISLLKGGSK